MQFNQLEEDKSIQSLKISPYQRYLALNEQYNQEPTIDLLHNLCWNLVIAAQDTPEAKHALGAFSSEISRRCDPLRMLNATLLMRLRQISNHSPLYHQAQLEIFKLLYSKRYLQVYLNLQDRFNDLVAAVTALWFSQITTSTPTKEHIYSMAAQMLALEISGNNPVPKQQRTLQNYPFRVQAFTQIRELPLLAKTLKLKFRYQQWRLETSQYIRENLVIIQCSASKLNGYFLSISQKNLNHSKAATVFIDKQTKQEIARVTAIPHGLKLVAYGAKLEIVLEHDINLSQYFFDNPIGDLKIVQKRRGINLRHFEANANKVTYHGESNEFYNQEHKSQFIIRGHLVIAKNSKLYAQTLFIQASDCTINGSVQVGNQWALKTDSCLQISPTASISANESVIEAGVIKEIRGKINVTQIKIISRDGIYLHGAGVIKAKMGIVQARSIVSTDKFSIVAESLQVVVSAILDIDKESFWQGNIVVIQSEKINNYSQLSGDQCLEINAKEFSNYSSGLLKSKKIIKINGNNFNNTGGLKSESAIALNLNQLCVHGISTWQDFTAIFQNTTGLAHIEAPNVTISAGGFMNFLGRIKCGVYSLNSIVEAGGFGILESNSTSKRRLFSIDYTLEIPNFQQTLEGLSHLGKLVKNGEFKEIFQETLTTRNLITALSTVRWGFRNFIPVIGKSIDFIWSVGMILLGLPAFYAQLRFLYQKGGNIEPYDLYPLIGTLASLENQAYSLTIQTEGLHQVENILTMDSKDLPPIKIDWPERAVYLLAIDLASLFSPMEMNDSLISLSGGIRMTGTEIHRSLFEFQAGELAAALSITDTYLASCQQASVKVSGNISELGNNLDLGKSVAILTGQCSTNLHEQKIAGHIHGISRVDLSGDKIHTTASSHIDAYTDKVTLTATDEIKHEGSIHGKEVFFHANNQLELGETADIDGEKISGTSKHIVQNSHVHLHSSHHEVIKEGSNDHQPISAYSVPPASDDHKSETATAEQTLSPDLMLTATDNLDIDQHSRVEGDSQTVIYFSGENINDAGTASGEKIYENASGTLTRTESANISGSHTQLHGHILSDSGHIQVVSGETNTPDDKIPAVVLDGDQVHTTVTSQIDGRDKIVLIRGENISESGSANGSVILNHATHNLDLDANAHQKAGVIGLDAENAHVNHASLETKGLAVNIDNFTDVEDLTTGSGEFDHVKADDIIDVTTKTDVSFSRDHPDIKPYVSLTCPNVHLNADILHSQKGLAFNVDGDIRVRKNQKITSDHDLIIHTKGSYTNEGEVKGDVTDIDAEHKIINTGLTQGFTHLNINAKENIENQCIQEDYWGGYDWMKHYTPGRFLGGTGKGCDGVGCNIHTSGKLVNTGSEIISIGDNNIVADKGISSEGLVHYYISYYHDEGNTDKADIDYQLQTAKIYSLAGQNKLATTDDGIHSCSTDFYGYKGTDFYAPDDRDIDLTGFTPSSMHSGGGGGFFGSNDDIYTQASYPTLVIGSGDIRIHGRDVNLDNIKMYTEGTFKVKARNLHIGAPTLNYTYNSNDDSFSVNPGSASQINFVSMYQDTEALANSTDGGETVLNGANLTIDTINSTNQALRALRCNDPLSALVASSVLVASLDYKCSQRSIRGQRVGQTGVYCKDLDLEISDTLTFEATDIKVDHNAKIRAKHFIQKDKELHFYEDDKNVSLGVGLSLDGSLRVHAGVNYSHTEATTYAIQHFTVGGAFDFEGESWEIEGTQNHFGRLQGHVKRLWMNSHQNTYSTESTGLQVDSKGNVGVQHSSFGSSSVDQTEMEIGDADFTADEGYVRGSKISVKGENHLCINHLQTESIDESSEGNSWGVSMNVNSLTHQDPNGNGEVIPTVSVQHCEQDYQATQHSVVGDSSDSGLVVQKDEKHDYNAKVPLVHHGSLQKFTENIEWAYDQLHSPKTNPEVSLKPVNSEPKSPDEDKEHKEHKEHKERKESKHSNFNDELLAGYLTQALTDSTDESETFFNDELVAGYLDQELQLPASTSENHYGRAIVDGVESGVKNSIITPFFLINDMLAIDLLSWGLGKYMNPEAADAATARMNSRVASIRQTGELIIDLGIYSGVMVIRHMASPTMREIGSELENTPYFKKIKTDLNDEVVSIRIDYHHFMNSTPEEKTETLSRLLTEFLLPTGLMRGGEVMLNRHRFGLTDYPPVFFPDPSATGILSKSPVMKHYKVDDIRQTKGEGDFYYVIMPNGELRITSEKIDKSVEENRDIKYQYSSHVELAGKNPVAGAGQMYTKEGMIIGIDWKGTDYLLSGSDHLEDLTEKVFGKNGFKEIKGKFGIEPQREPTPSRPAISENELKNMFGENFISEFIAYAREEMKSTEITSQEDRPNKNNAHNHGIFGPGIIDIVSKDSEKKENTTPTPDKKPYMDRLVDFLVSNTMLYVPGMMNIFSDPGFVRRCRGEGSDCKSSSPLFHSQSRYHIFGEQQQLKTGSDQSKKEEVWCGVG